VNLPGGVVCALVIAGCGRLEFESRPLPARDGNAADSDGLVIDPDVAIDALPCGPMTCGVASEFVDCAGRCFANCRVPVAQGEAEQQCIAWGGHLASFRMPAETTCAAPVVGGTRWLGLTQSAAAMPEVGWSWLDGSATSYFNWRTTSTIPDDGDGVEDGAENCALTFDDGTWDDVPCDFQLDILCVR
jgi:hypothetical protein